MSSSHFIGAISLATAMLFASDFAHSETKRAEQASIIPSLSKLQPMIDCISHVKVDDEKGKGDCFSKSKFSLNRAELDSADPPHFKSAVVAFWLLSDSAENNRMQPKAYSEALDYARCVEAAAYADKSFSGRTEAKVKLAMVRAEVACKAHPLSLTGVNPKTADALPNLRERLFASAIAKTSMRYALMANHWFPDEMLECRRYLDGRPPSRGCAFRKQGVPPYAPPPPPRPADKN